MQENTLFKCQSFKLKTIVKVLSISLLLSACNDTNQQSSKKEVTHPAEKSEQQAESTTTHSVEKNDISQVESLQILYKEAKQKLFQSRHFSATLYGLSSDDVGYNYSDLSEDYSPKQEKKLRQELALLSQKISNFPLQNATQSDKENQLVMTSLTRYFSGHPDFSIGYIDVWMGLSPFIINQINGPLIDIPRYMQSDQPITNESQAKAYIKRLSQFDTLLGSIQQKAKADVDSGWIPPKIVLQGAQRYLKNFLSEKAENHPLVKNFQEKVSLIDELTEQQKKSLIESATKTVSEVVYPAYQKVTEQTEQLLDKARDESGIWAQPDGEKYYQDAIKQLGDSDLSAEQIHQVGLDEVKRITTQMDLILKEQGYKEGTVGERMVALNEEPRFLFEDSKAGRKALLDSLNGYIEEMNIAMSDLFQTKPKYQVEVRAFPEEIQDGAPGGQYTPPAVDGSKPGIYWINLRDMKANPKFGLKSLTYHEANPGHHWQIALNLEQESLPFLRRIAPYNAYTEGWALYSEKVAAEIGMYKNDPFGDLGRLQAELFRAVRLVVDTGIHHKKWTREEAIDYMAKTTGSAKSDVISEIERYMAWPGQALGYKLGMLKILELRANAQEKLGDKFDLAAFHDLVLLGGAVPMSVLEEKIEHWISNQQLAKNN